MLGHEDVDLFTILLGWICFRHANKYFGFWMASCFLIGSFVFTGLEESMWIEVKAPPRETLRTG